MVLEMVRWGMVKKWLRTPTLEKVITPQPAYFFLLFFFVLVMRYIEARFLFILTP